MSAYDDDPRVTWHPESKNWGGFFAVRVPTLYDGGRENGGRVVQRDNGWEAAAHAAYVGLFPTCDEAICSLIGDPQ